MKILSCKLVGYKPLSHRGTTALSFTPTAPMQVIIGDNGSGKSSLIRELSVIAPTSTLYTTAGIKELVIEHEGHTYELGVEFSNKKYSFKEDGVELNISGHMKEQDHLVEHRLGWTESVRTIMTHGLSISRKRAADRKALLTAAYPSDLTFVLEHHKGVVRALNVCQAELTTMITTKDQLEANLLPQDKAVELQGAIDGMTQAAKRLDNEIFALKQDQVQLQTALDQLPPCDIQDLEQHVQSCVKELFAIRADSPGLFNGDNLDVLAGSTKAVLDSATQEQKQLAKHAAEITHRLTEYETALNQVLNNELDAIKTQITAVDQQIAACDVDDAVPVLRSEDMQRLEQSILPQIKQLLEAIGGEPVWPSNAIIKANDRLRQWSYQLRDYQKQLEQVTERLKEAKHNLDQHTSLAPRIGCVEDCKLRSSYVRTLKRDELVYEQTLNHHDQLTSHIQVLNRKITKLTEASSRSRSLASIITELEELFAWYNWLFYVLNGVPLRRAISYNATTILSRLHRMLAVNKQRDHRDRLLLEKTQLKTKHDTLQQAHLPTKDLLEKTLRYHRQQLETVTQRLNVLTTAIERSTFLLRDITDLQTIKQQLTQAKEEVLCYANRLYLTTQLQINDNILQLFTEHYQAITQRIRATQTVLSKQTNDVRYRDELVIPKIKTLQHKLEVLKNLETALSPVSGLSVVYMVRFFNTIIKTINTIINSIFSSELKLCELTADQLTYEFPVEHNGTSRISDISLCSEGQKDIIDLAWTITIAELKGLLHRYPLFLDEPDKGISVGNRTRVLELWNRMVQQGTISQLFLVNHHASLYGSIANADVLCLCADNIAVPATYNTHAVIT